MISPRTLQHNKAATPWDAFVWSIRVLIGLFFRPLSIRVLIGLLFRPLSIRVLMGLFFRPLSIRVLIGLFFRPWLPSGTAPAAPTSTRGARRVLRVAFFSDGDPFELPCSGGDPVGFLFVAFENIFHIKRHRPRLLCEIFLRKFVGKKSRPWKLLFVILWSRARATGCACARIEVFLLCFVLFRGLPRWAHNGRRG